MENKQMVETKNNNPQSIGEITKDILVKYLDSFGLTANLSDNEKNQFLEIALAYNLNPFKREIYCIPYGDGHYRKLSIITGYEIYLKRAERTGKLAGWETKFNDKYDQCTITIFRHDWKMPLIHDVFLKEYEQKFYDKKSDSWKTNKMWTEKPITMLRKVAIAQGFRLAFPDELGGMPYTSDELPDNMTNEKTEINITPKENVTTIKTVVIEKNDDTKLLIKADECLLKTDDEIKKEEIKSFDARSRIQALSIILEKDLGYDKKKRAEIGKTILGNKKLNEITENDIKKYREFINDELKKLNKKDDLPEFTEFMQTSQEHSK